ncbi:cytochrome P450 [Dendrothele bispora CBS 962.96]|uniref:Cytochrome P450 n=1 Tax=Dendrothele bispora (strain CBS 962.96) TaxID=1314807 RepID=A0A4S8LF11_DENBC|nr:cytochrome P450 [Dendrothele bispora CBS 962.96]
MFLLQHGDDMWRRMRKSSVYALGQRVAPQYQPIQTEQGVLLAHDMLESPKHWSDFIQRATASSILSIVYDLPPIQSLPDPATDFMNDFIARFAQAMCPGTYLVEFLPILDYVPALLAKWKRDATKDFIQYTKTFEELFTKVKEISMKGEAEQTSFCATLLKPEARHGLSDRESAWLAATLYVAGYETSTATFGWLIFCMLLFPEVQDKAQEELDRIVGRSRLPTFADAKHLPYIRAIIREVLRWRPATPISLPHATLNDDFYENSFIPGSSLCLANVWSINRDPDVYGDDADEFHPERHLNPDGSLKDPLGEGHYTYGFGQRECAGRHVANNSLFIYTVTVLWTMKIEPPKDEEGNVVLPNINDEKTDGVALHPPSFDIMTVPRFEQAIEILQHARDDVLSQVGSRRHI